MVTEGFKELIDMAIEQEIEAYNFYTRVSQSLTDFGLVKIFSELAGEEQGHKALLEEIKKDVNLHFRFDEPNKDYHLAEKTELPPLSIDMKPADAFALAMKKEQQAAEFYRELAVRANNQEIKRACNHLSNMELQHKQEIENAYIDVAYPESF